MSDADSDRGSGSKPTNTFRSTRRRTLALLSSFGGLGLGGFSVASNRSVEVSHGPTVDPDTEFSVAIFPDTQHYAKQDNGIFELMGQWVADSRDEFNVRMVLHEGDLVQSYGSDNRSEWDIAQDAVGRIDGEDVPTLLALGNHDADDVRDPRTFRSRFPASRYEEIERSDETILDWGTFEGSAENAYLLQEIHGERFLYITLEFGPRDGALNWGGRVMEDHAEATAVLLTHTYLSHAGTRTSSSDDHAPSAYEGGVLPVGSDYTNGAEMWRTGLRFHGNLAIVHSGHHVGESRFARRADYTTTGGCVARRTDPTGIGDPVEQMFMNYQTIDNGGDGWLRLLTINTETYAAEMNTYSPYLEEWSDDARESFEFALPDRSEEG